MGTQQALTDARSPSAQKMTSAISSVVHVTSWLSRQGSGGIPPVVWALAGAMRHQGASTSVVGLHDEWVSADCANHSLPLKTGNVVGPASFGYSPGLAEQLRGCAKSSGIIHSHGLWMYPGFAARKSAIETKGSLVISPHGMLEPWALNRARLKKRLVSWLFENKNLRMANCLHALCAAEADHFRQIGLTNPIAVIPNGVELDGLQPKADREALVERFPELKDRRRVLFLSRLHPKKGLDNLLRAWKNLGTGFAEWSLMIAGNQHLAYGSAPVRSLVRELELKALLVSFSGQFTVLTRRGYWRQPMSLCCLLSARDLAWPYWKPLPPVYARSCLRRNAISRNW